jgi:hypothetical protein
MNMRGNDSTELVVAGLLNVEEMVGFIWIHDDSIPKCSYDIININTNFTRISALLPGYNFILLIGHCNACRTQLFSMSFGQSFFRLGKLHHAEPLQNYNNI